MTAGLRGVHRDRPRMVAAGGLLVAAVGDAAQGWDGPGPLIVAGVALVVAVVSTRVSAILAAATSILFLVGAFANAEVPAALGGGPAAAFVAAVVQVLGFGVALAGAVWLVLDGRGRALTRAGADPRGGRTRRVGRGRGRRA